MKLGDLLMTIVLVMHLANEAHPKPYKFTNLHKFQCWQRCKFNYKFELD